MKIQGVIVANVNGGIKKYLTYFLTEELLRKSDQRPQCIELFNKMEEMTAIISDSITSINSISEDESPLL